MDLIEKYGNTTRNNKKVLDWIDKKIEHQKSILNVEDFNIWIEDLHEQFYIQINESILLSNEPSLLPYQKAELWEQLNGMNEFFFNRLSELTPGGWLWKEAVEMDWILKVGEHYIKPKSFNYEVVSNAINDLSNKSNSEEELHQKMLELFRNKIDDGANYPNHQKVKKGVPNTEKDYKDEVWFRVGLLTATGYIHTTNNNDKSKSELFNTYKNPPKIKNAFIEDENLNKRFISKFQLNSNGTNKYFLNKDPEKFILGTLNKNGFFDSSNPNAKKNIYNRSLSDLQKIDNHLESIGLESEICQYFKDKLREKERSESN